jgi:hypothetical protein
VGPVQGEVLRDEVALTDEMVLLDGDRPEVVVDDSQDALQPLAALRAGGVVHHVGSHEVIEHRAVTGLLSPEQLLDDILGAALAHDANPKPGAPVRLVGV